jgi:hypothetical protein
MLQSNTILLYYATILSIFFEAKAQIAYSSARGAEEGTRSSI